LWNQFQIEIIKSIFQGKANELFCKYLFFSLSFDKSKMKKVKIDFLENKNECEKITKKNYDFSVYWMFIVK
jgi:hypothetical protein